jgi:Mg/Co/Ni transporter MgtE
MTTVKQPTPLPTNKLSASLIGMVLGAVAFEILATYFPTLRTVEIAGFGDLSMVSQLLMAGLIGYVIPDRPNVQQ